MSRTRHAASLVLFLCLGAPLAVAGTLQGTVVGKEGAPKEYVRVEVSGPASRTVFTGEDGSFSLELPGGRYVLRVSERNRHMSFDVDVPDKGPPPRCGPGCSTRSSSTTS